MPMFKKFLALSGTLFMLFSGMATAKESFTASDTKTWTVDDARKEAFQDVQPFINISQFPAIDPNLMQNRSAIASGGGKIGDRSVTVFDSGVYGVVSLCQKTVYYYTFDGRLFKISIESTAPLYDSTCAAPDPSKTWTYFVAQVPGSYVNYRPGQLIRVSIRVKDREAYQFLPDGALSSHWIGDKCYEANGASCGTRH